jgi:hypothetical protein
MLIGLATAVWAAVGTAPARASDPTRIPVQVRLAEPGGLAACPGGTVVNFEPDPTSAPSFVLVNPGPSQCPAGIALLTNPRTAGSLPGSAVRLPLQASSCSTAQAVFAQVADLLGAPAGVPGVAPSSVNVDPTGVCPDADVAFAALSSALASVPSVPGTAGLVVQPRNGPEVIVAFLEGDPDQPIVIGTINFTGAAPAGVFLEREVVISFVDGDPDQPIVIGVGRVPQLFVLVPSATPGVAAVRCWLC